MQLKLCVLPLLALVSLAAADPLHLGYGQDYVDSLDAQVHQQGAERLFDLEITQQDADFHGRRKRAVAIFTAKDSNKCLAVRNAKFAKGTPVQIYDCNGTNGQRWIIDRRAGQIRVAGTNFCLDASHAPRNGVGLKIWTCYKNLPAQKWRYRGDKTIRLRSTNLCVDLTRGSLANGRQTQVWSCIPNKNQIWGTRT